jgi:signal transduction histidine kinase
MKKIFTTLFVCLVVITFAIPAFAASDPKKELIEAVDHSVKVLETKGKAGMDELKSYRFANGEGYVYITNMEFIVIMHPVAPELVNKDCTTIKDAKGKYFGAEMKGKALKYGEGWTTYSWPNKAKGNAPEAKCSHYKIAKLPDGSKLIVYAALFGVGNCE